MDLFLALLTAHLIGDFILQSAEMVRKKHRPSVLLRHSLVVTFITLCCLLLSGQHYWPILVTTFFSHAVIDWIKLRFPKDSPRSFLLDQAAHLAVIILLAVLFHGPLPDTFWDRSEEVESQPWLMIFFTLTSGVILLTQVSGIAIQLLTRPFALQIDTPLGLEPRTESDPSGKNYLNGGLDNGGKWIGWLERLLVMLFVLLGQPTGIGFLIAAKSILRFGEIKESKHRKVAEYVIIGTFLSFGLALALSIAMKLSLNYWSAELPATQKSFFFK